MIEISVLNYFGSKVKLLLSKLISYDFIIFCIIKKINFILFYVCSKICFRSKILNFWSYWFVQSFVFLKVSKSFKIIIVLNTYKQTVKICLSRFFIEPSRFLQFLYANNDFHMIFPNLAEFVGFKFWFYWSLLRHELHNSWIYIFTWYKQFYNKEQICNFHILTDQIF